MLQKIIGRKEEQKTLQDCYESNKPEFVAVYGRRRIGKTFLVKQFFKEKFDFYFTGAYQATKKDQLFNFKMTLESYSGVKRKTPQTWLEAFFQLKDYLASLGDRRKVVFIDELPWFDTHAPTSSALSNSSGTNGLQTRTSCSWYAVQPPHGWSISCWETRVDYTTG